MKKVFTNILCFIICILVLPSMIIHTAYRIWYFKKFILETGGKNLD